MGLNSNWFENFLAGQRNKNNEELDKAFKCFKKALDLNQSSKFTIYESEKLKRYNERIEEKDLEK